MQNKEYYTTFNYRRGILEARWACPQRIVIHEKSPFVPLSGTTGDVSVKQQFLSRLGYLKDLICSGRLSDVKTNQSAENRHHQEHPLLR